MFFFFKIVLVHLGSFYFSINYRISLSISTKKKKKSAGSLIRIALSPYINLGFGENSHLNIKLSLAILSVAYRSIYLGLEFFSAMFSRFQCKAIPYVFLFGWFFLYLPPFIYSSMLSGSEF